MPKLILGLVGRKGSGKGTVANILAERYGAKVFRFSAVLADILRRMALEETHDNLIRLSEILRHEFGEDVLRHAIMAQIERDGGDLIVLDGLRRIEDLKGFEALGTFKILNVTAPLELRYKRITVRDEKAKETEMTFDEFVRMQTSAPTEVTIADVEARATYHIDNSGTQDELASKVEEIVRVLQASQNSTA